MTKKHAKQQIKIHGNTGKKRVLDERNTKVNIRVNKAEELFLREALKRSNFKSLSTFIRVMLFLFLSRKHPDLAKQLQDAKDREWLELKLIQEREDGIKDN